MYKILILCAIVLSLTDVPRASMENVDYTALVCFSDSTGRTVRVSAPDTTLVVKDAIKAVLKSGGYEVTTKKGDVRFFIKPPFRSIEVISDEEEGNSEDKSHKRRKRKKDE